MAFPDNLTQVWVTGTLLNFDGSAVQGRITFTPTVPDLLNADAHLMILANKPPFATLDEDGYFQILLPSTDDPVAEPSGWTYTVREPLGRSYPIVVRASTPVLDDPGGDLDGQRVAHLAGVIAASPPNGGWVQVIVGPRGPEGPEGPGVDEAGVQAIADVAVATHVADATPHPAYDDLPSLTLIFENALV